MLATAASGAVIGARGADLSVAFHGAALVGAAMATLAGIAAWISVAPGHAQGKPTA